MIEEVVVLASRRALGARARLNQRHILAAFPGFRPTSPASGRGDVRC